MKKIIIIPLIIISAILFVEFKNPDGNNNTIKVIITNLKVAKGYAGFGLYNNAADFPKAGKTMLQKNVAVKSIGSVTIELNNIEDGSYAIGASHDVNGNGKFDMNFLGIPEEPFGFSNNIRHNFSAPTFDECKFTVKGGEVKTITIKVD